MQLKAAALRHRRSMNSEVIMCLEAMWVPTSVAPAERLSRERALRASLQTPRFDAADIDALKRDGRV